MSLNISDLSARGPQPQLDRGANVGGNAAPGGSLLGDKSRQDEVQRLAQNVAAEHFGVGQQPPQNGNSAYVDQAKISNEAIEELARSGKDIQRSDQLVSALKESFQSRQQDQNGQNGNRDGANGANGAAGGQQQKKLEKKRTAHWEPIAQENQIHPEGQEVIGKITIKEEVREVQGAGQGAQTSNQGAASRGAGNDSGGGGAASGSSPQTGNSTSPSPAGGTGNGNGAQPVQGGKDNLKSQDEEGKNDKENAAVAQSLKASGLQSAPGMEQGAENYEVGDKSKDFDVRSPATGASQTLTMRSAGKLGEGEQKLGTYKRLDNSPALRYASMHARGESRERTAETYAQAAQQQGERPDQVKENVDQLQKSTPDGG